MKPIPVNEQIANVSYLKHEYASVAQLAQWENGKPFYGESLLYLKLTLATAT
ncbi:hypothetical protein KL866_00260 [Alteromonas sp. ALT199]|uniref:hypothetical protein n=1 Tax=unclassified Alteromonas TaxID=2614992 RepID=UPI001BE6BBAD|nr:hypothetical protein [Alteromonas sp. ALT199]MBT3133570.1 hypothetical protein [Alteromonas sp. ALT199]